MKAVVQWVLKTMMKDQTGVMRTLPKKDLVDFNVAMTAERLARNGICLLYTSPSPRDGLLSRMPSSA